MKKIVRSLIFIGLVLSFGAVANAQLSTQYVAEIPFDFQVRDKAFKAGSYRLEPVNGVTSIAAVTLRSRADNSSQVIGVAHLYSDSGDTGKLIFLKQNGQHMLQRISTPTISMKFKTAAAGKLAQVSPGPEAEIVAIDLR